MDHGRFNKGLKALHEQGFVSSKNVQFLTAALDAGSAAAHRGYVGNTEEVNAVMDIVENLLQSVYALEDLAEQLEKSTPPPTRSSSKKAGRLAGSNGSASATPRWGIGTQRRGPIPHLGTGFRGLKW